MRRLAWFLVVWLGLASPMVCVAEGGGSTTNPFEAPTGSLVNRDELLNRVASQKPESISAEEFRIYQNLAATIDPALVLNLGWMRYVEGPTPVWDFVYFTGMAGAGALAVKFAAARDKWAHYRLLNTAAREFALYPPNAKQAYRIAWLEEDHPEFARRMRKPPSHIRECAEVIADLVLRPYGIGALPWVVGGGLIWNDYQKGRFTPKPK